MYIRGRPTHDAVFHLPSRSICYRRPFAIHMHSACVVLFTAQRHGCTQSHSSPLFPTLSHSLSLAPTRSLSFPTRSFAMPATLDESLRKLLLTVNYHLHVSLHIVTRTRVHSKSVCTLCKRRLKTNVAVMKFNELCDFFGVKEWKYATVQCAKVQSTTVHRVRQYSVRQYIACDVCVCDGVCAAASSVKIELCR